MTQYAMTIDERLCVGCGACVVACSNENRVPDDKARCWTVQVHGGTFPQLWMETRSERCNHCVNAPCVEVCPTRASHHDVGGIVVVTASKCIGCKTCMLACPYDVRYVHPAGHVEKCTFCIHRVLDGKDPACATVCPTHAITFGDLDDPRSTVAHQLRQRKYKVLKPEEDTEPRLFLLTCS